LIFFYDLIIKKLFRNCNIKYYTDKMNKKFTYENVTKELNNIFLNLETNI